MSVPMKHILVLEPDRTFALRLTHALSRIGDFNVSMVDSLKDACLQLVQNDQDLAFVPVAEGAKIVRSLRAVQPDLRIILVMPSGDEEIPVTYSGNVQGVLIKSLVDVELETLVENVWQRPMVQTGQIDSPVTQDAIRSLDIATLIATLQEAHLGRLLQTIVFARGSKLLAYWGELNESEAAAVALHVGESWQENALPSRLQFIHLPARAGDLLLFSHQVTDDFLVTIVALPEAPLTEVRQQARRMAKKLTAVVEGRILAHTGLLGNGLGMGVRPSFVIVWRPLEPLPRQLHIPLRRAMSRLAMANACVLTHVQVQADLIQLVVTVPPGRDAGWAAYLFKNGSEQTIHQEFKAEGSLWETGFYATESAEPLTEAELNLFLDSSSETAESS
ncbi:response regulator [Candidatus Leptofilum sp.]|uniref:response regulator n=1 Tax=Candidatus Leptofilum sp. TaxID=3241576 RepID=UPI003B5C23DC